MQLTASDVRDIARRANWFFDVNQDCQTQDWVVYTGDGIDDLDRLISLIASGTHANFRMTVDTGIEYSSYKPCDLEDVQAIRTAFVDFYGTVAKPNAYEPLKASGFEIYSGVSL